MKMNRIERAFRAVIRKQFLPPDQQNNADLDMPLSIGHGQTNSQPSTVRVMLGWLDAQPGNKVLDVGSGSGWTTALLSHIVGPNGRVYAVEKVPELVEFGRSNNKNAGITNATFYNAEKAYGLPEYAPFDRILVSASARQLPEELLSQLKVSGKIVIPIKSDILEITRVTNDNYQTVVHPGFVFVPLV